MALAVTILLAAAVVLIVSSIILGRSLRLAIRDIRAKRNYRWVAVALAFGTVAYCVVMVAIFALVGPISSTEPLGANLIIALAPFVVGGGAFAIGIAVGDQAK